MTKNLAGFEWAAKDKCRQNKRFGHSIVALDISGRIGFSVALRLRFRKRFGVVATRGHSAEDVVGGTIEDATNGSDIGARHALADGT